MSTIVTMPGTMTARVTVMRAHIITGSMPTFHMAHVFAMFMVLAMIVLVGMMVAMFPVLVIVTLMRLNRK